MKRDKKQLDIFGLVNPKVGAMRRLRDMRHKAGFVEVTIWVPEEQREQIKDHAKGLIKKTGRHFPSAGDEG